MANFGFITSDEFRAALEADFTELQACMKASAWKAAHVLSGSIIEALLIDVLQSSGYSGCTNEQLLKKQLGDIIAICKTEAILTDKTVSLCSVVQSYRNLIHPGRLIRLQESVDEQGATIAEALVEIIVGEVAAVKKKTYGYTAEQIVDKVQRDSRAIAIMGHLLKETNTAETERLLLKVLPAYYLDVCRYEYSDDGPGMESTKRDLSRLFRLAFSSAEADLKKRVTQKYIVLLKEESEHVVRDYERAFFRVPDMDLLGLGEAKLVKLHLLAVAQQGIDATLAEVLTGIWQYVDATEAATWIDVCVRSIANGDNQSARLIERIFNNQPVWGKDDVYKAATMQLKMLQTFYGRKEAPRHAVAIATLQSLIEIDESDPFADE